jgi:hypothetical protein
MVASTYEANGSGSPIEYPKVTIGAEVLTVKIGLLAESIISRAGLSIDQALEPLKSGSKNPRNLDLLFQLFSAAVAHNYKSMGLSVPTADDWIAKVEAVGGEPESNAPIITSMKVALVEAVVKRWPSLRAVPQGTAPSQDTAPKSETPN